MAGSEACMSVGDILTGRGREVTLEAEALQGGTGALGLSTLNHTV